MNELAPHSCVAVKNLEGYLSCRGLHGIARGYQPQTRLPAQASSAGEKNPTNFWLWKPVKIGAE